MALIIIHADGLWFIICTLTIAASILHFSIQLYRAAKAVEKSIPCQKDAQPPESTFQSQGTTTQDSTPPAQITQGPAPWRDSAGEAPEPIRRHSFSTTMHTLRRRLSLPRSKSLSLLWGANRKPSVDTPQLPPPWSVDPLGLPTLAEPFKPEGQDDLERAEPPMFTPGSSATIEVRSAAEDDSMQLPKDYSETEPPNLQMASQQTTLAAPAAVPAPMSTTSSSSSSASPQPRPRSTPAPKGPRPRPASMSALGVDGQRRYARPACPENSLPGEIFETRFENPFKPRSRSLTVKGAKAGAAETPKRQSIFTIFSTLRKSLVKHKFGPGSEASPSASESPSPSASLPSSRRTSLSSATGTTLSVGSGSGSGSIKSKWSCMRNGVPRTDPYGPPHFAQMPVSNSEGRNARRRSRRT